MRMSLPIRTRLTLLVLATALPLVALLAYNGARQAEFEAERASAEALRAARAAAVETETLLSTARRLLTQLGQRQSVNALDAKQCDPIFRSFRGLFPTYTNLISVHRNGDRVCSAIEPAPGAPLRISAGMPLQQALDSGEFAVGQVNRGVFTGRWVLLVAQPLPARPNAEGRMETPGVLAMAIDLASVRLAPGPGELPPQALARIVDANGLVIASSLAPDQWIGQSLAHLPWFKELVPGQARTGQSRDHAGVERIFGVAPIQGTAWHAAVGIPVDRVYGPVRERALFNAVLSVLAVLLAAGLAYGVARRTAAPVEAMAAAARRASVDHSALALEGITLEGAPREVQALAEDFRDMLVARALAEQALRDSEESLATTLHSIGDAVIATDDGGRITRINAAAERLTGWPTAEALGRPLAEVFRIVNDDTHEPAPDPVQRVLTHGDVVGLANHTALLSREGREYQISDSAAPIRNAQGRITGVVLVFSDVTEPYRVQQALAAREERLRSTGELARVGGWELDIATQQTTTSDEMCQLLEVAPGSSYTMEEGWAFLRPAPVRRSSWRCRRRSPTARPGTSSCPWSPQKGATCGCARAGG